VCDLETWPIGGCRAKNKEHTVIPEQETAATLSVSHIKHKSQKRNVWTENKIFILLFGSAVLPLLFHARSLHNKRDIYINHIVGEILYSLFASVPFLSSSHRHPDVPILQSP
jgi:hypothetical protein